MTSPRPARALLVPLLTVTLAVTGLGIGLTRSAAGAAVPVYQDSGQPVAARVTDLLGRMSLDDKLGQMTQAERAVISPADLASARIGSVLSGGGSVPAPNTPTAWADMVDAYQRAALSTPLAIPMIYGVDAVHGHNNLVGATIFPHNIGLGATRDPALAQRIGRATAEEVAGTGVRWDFAPCLCVARDDRWGRTYESFGETPAIVSPMASVVTGLQGSTLGGPASVLATAKHYVGDGGTAGGDDQGDTQLSEADLRAIHLPPFAEAVRRGVGSVMVSFSSWNGAKLHGNRYLVTDVLKGELGFPGFVVSDWAGIDQIDGAPGFSATDVRTGVNAGIDMVMVPNEWRAFLATLRAEVQAGRIPMTRIDDANRRILTKKLELGLFERPLADRSTASTIGGAEHRALARQAVRQSQVLLKNTGVLPLPTTGGRIFVAGKNADDIGNQSGGWTVSWQGGSGSVTTGTTILQGIRAAAGSSTVTYSRDGSGIDRNYTAAVAVIGETPYAEGQGDRPGGLGLDATDLATLDRLRASGVPVVAVLVSGRPLDIAAQLPNWSAAVAAWLPGTEGGGVADVLFGAYNPTGTLPVTWMAGSAQQPVNAGDGKPALFPLGHGLRYPAGPGPTPTPSPTPSPTLSPSPTPTPTLSPSPTPSPTPSQTSPAGGCSVTYQANSWSTGLTADVTVRNTGPTAVTGWTLRWTWGGGQRVTSGWTATVTQTGAEVTATNPPYAATIPAGGSTSFGFQATHTGSNPAPAAYSLNGLPCVLS